MEIKYILRLYSSQSSKSPGGIKVQHLRALTITLECVACMLQMMVL